MNKKYIDFVPTKPASKSTAKRFVEKPAVARPKHESSAEELDRSVNTTLPKNIQGSGAGNFTVKEGPIYGVIEDFRPKFVKTEVEKRPLSRGHFVEQKSDLVEAKSKKVAAKKLEKPVEKSVEKSGKTDKKVDFKKDETQMKIPKSPFINQNKVTKRPLSKNVYTKTVKPTEEISTGPVTIISKPEKDAKVSLVVTIILTIILGAAAGTIAFLLLPK